MRVLDPTGVTPPALGSTEPWTMDVRGKTVGILWNGKPNADNMFRVLERRLKDNYGVAETVWVNKSATAEGPGRPATDEILNRLAAGTVAVLTGSGD